MKGGYVKLTKEQKDAFMDIVEAMYYTKVDVYGHLPIHFAFALNRIAAMVYSSTLILEDYDFYVNRFKLNSPTEWTNKYGPLLGEKVRLWETESESDSN